MQYVTGDLRVLDAMRDGDKTDYRAMFAREVFAERHFRINGVSSRFAAECLKLFGDTGLRECVEAENGEPLA